MSNSTQTRMTNEDLKEHIEATFGQEKGAHLHRYANIMIELMADHLEKQVVASEKQGKDNVTFLQFWNVRKNKHDEYSATFKSHSAARQLTTIYNDNDQQVVPRMHEYFYQVLTKAPAFLQYIEELVALAKEKGEPAPLHAAKNLIHLFKVIMLSVMDMVYQTPDTWVTLSPLGQFTRCFRLTRNNHDDKVKGGVIQFYPTYL